MNFFTKFSKLVAKKHFGELSLLEFTLDPHSSDVKNILEHARKSSGTSQLFVVIGNVGLIERVILEAQEQSMFTMITKWYFIFDNETSTVDSLHSDVIQISSMYDISFVQADCGTVKQCGTRSQLNCLAEWAYYPVVGTIQSIAQELNPRNQTNKHHFKLQVKNRFLSKLNVSSNENVLYQLICVQYHGSFISHRKHLSSPGVDK